MYDLQGLPSGYRLVHEPPLVFLVFFLLSLLRHRVGFWAVVVELPSNILNVPMLAMFFLLTVYTVRLSKVLDYP